MIFGTDLDDCIIETAKTMLRYFGMESKYNQCETYSLSDLGLTESSIQKAIYIVLSSSSSIPLVDGAVEALNSLDKYGYNKIAFISQRKNIHKEVTLKLLNSLNLKLPWRLYFSHHDDNLEKWQIIKSAGIDIFVEDRLETALDIWARTDAEVIIFDRPWNRYINLLYGLYRMYGWGELDEVMLKMQRV